MFSLVASIYRAVVPESIRAKLLERRKTRRVEKLKQEIVSYYSTLPASEISEEKKAVLDYLKKNSLHVFPYEFQKKYEPGSVKVNSDSSGLKYVLHEGKKLYFKKSWSEARIQDSYSFLSCEQHIDSPHRYLTNEFYLEDNSIVADAGAAEGIFALGLVEKIKHLYLFETDPEWIAALEQTYKPWKEKVTIVNKFVSNRNDGQHVSLDNYFKNKPGIDFLKVDVDGAETDLLEGAKEILKSNKKLKLALCTYHRQQDEQLFGDLLRKFGFTVSTSSGYMLFSEGNFAPPYLRRGLIRAVK